MNKFSFTLMLLLVCFIHGSFSSAQEMVKIKRSEFKIDDKEGFKNAWRSIKDANDLFEEGIGTYREARELYLDAYEYNTNNAELNYMIGICYIHTDNKYEAPEYLEKAYELDPNVTEDILLLRARAYHLTYKFSEAIEEYAEYKNTLNRRAFKKQAGKIDNFIRQCENGMELIKDPKRVIIQNVGNRINSKYDDYYPIINNSDTLMYFTSRRPASVKSDRYIPDNKFFEDIYYSVKEDGEWQYAERMPKKVVGKKNNSNTAAVGLSNDLDRIYIYQGGESAGDIFYSEHKKSQWRKPKKIKGKINSSDKESALTFTSDGDKMYFVSTKSKKSFGGADIYMSTKNNRGKWSKPVNIGPDINTENNEIAVTLAENDSILFFSSDGHNTMGGFDVFRSILDEKGKWSKPVNIGYPINTADDDLFYTPIGKGRTGYYTSIRETGEGRKDIYKVIALGSEREMKHSVDNDFMGGFIPENENLFLVSPTKLSLDTSIIVQGTIISKDSREPIANASVEIVDKVTNTVESSVTSDEAGFYKLSARKAQPYSIEINAGGYLYEVDTID
ncbi:MAG: hypothetical protein GVY19_07260 [Bacteroidetes bacterium]|nr:hypothetical protein [Bacteroidota bacterium]